MSLLQVRGLCKRYAGAPFPSLSDFDLEVEQGELIALGGESGSGKTTALRLIAGFEKPSAGSISLDGHVLCDERTFVPPEERGVGMMFQDYALFPHLRVGQNVAFGLRQERNRERSVAEMLDLVNLTGCESRFPHELSGGQQQRVAIARALAPRPALLLLDEPLSNLDAASKAQVRDEIQEITSRARTTAIWVSHDIKHIMAGADRIAIISKGCLQQIGTPEQVYAHPANRYVAKFFGKTNLMMGQVVEDGVETPIGLLNIKDSGTIGTTVEIAIRPDQMFVVDGSHGPINGIVKRVHFQGEYCEVLVAVGACELSVNVSSERRVCVGDKLYLEPKLSAFQVLKPSQENRKD